MTEPSVLPEWDTAQVSMVATTADHKAEGYDSDEIPSSTEWNYQLNLIYLWLLYFKTQHPLTRTVRPTPYKATNWAITGDSTTMAGIYHVSSGAGTMEFFLNNELHEDQYLNDVNVVLVGDNAVDVTIDVWKHVWAGGPATLIGTATGTNVSSSGVIVSVTGLNVLVSQTNQIFLRVTANAAAAQLHYIVLEPL